MGRLIPEPGRLRINVKRWEALADGLMEASGLIVMERRRPAAQQSREWIDRKGTKVTQVLRASSHDLAERAWCAGEGYSLASRYAGDASPAVDTNLDGHTLNGDFGTSFTTWNLRIAEWELTDDVAVDPNKLPPGAPLPESPGEFDAPRTRVPGNAWWEVWYAFRQAIITHHVKDFSKWITTSAYPDDSGGGITVPADRWYSYQIPADYLFGGSPAAPNFRFVTSASPLLSADVFPNGGMGITSFNINQGANGPYSRTLAGALPVIKALHRRWAILEWNRRFRHRPHPTSAATTWC